MTEPESPPEFNSGFWYTVRADAGGPMSDAQAERRYRQAASARRRGRIQLAILGVVVVIFVLAIASGAFEAVLDAVASAGDTMSRGLVAGRLGPRG